MNSQKCKDNLVPEKEPSKQHQHYGTLESQNIEEKAVLHLRPKGNQNNHSRTLKSSKCLKSGGLKSELLRV